MLILSFASNDYIILCTAENLSLDEQDCGLDFFDRTDRRYPHRLNDDRKKRTQDVRPAVAGLRSFELGFALFKAFDTPVSAAFQNTNQFSKSSQSMLIFQPRRV
jgi:hypothetical protein